jgi:excinuclease ABC subunit A
VRKAPDRERRFSEKLACPNGHALAIDDLEPRSFSFNSPYGACPECTGLGIRKEVDPDLVVPDPDLSLADGAIAPWSMGHDAEYFGRLLSRASADDLGSRHDDAVAHAAGEGRKAILRRHRRTGARPLPQPVRPHPFLLRRLRRGHPVPAAPPRRRPSPSQMKERYEGYMRDAALPGVRGARLRRKSWR